MARAPVARADIPEDHVAHDEGGQETGEPDVYLYCGHREDVPKEGEPEGSAELQGERVYRPWGPHEDLTQELGSPE